jgi:hypothetical protein
MVNFVLTRIHSAGGIAEIGGAMKIFLVALFTVIAAVSVAGCAGTGKSPIETRG